MKRKSSTRGQVWLAWSAVVLCILVIGMFSTDSFSSDQTSRFIQPILNWLWPDLHWRTVHSIGVGVRKFAHLFEYGVLSLLACRAIWLSIETSLGRIAALAWVLVLFVATADETHQVFAPKRGGSTWDVVLDMAGGLASIFLFLVYRRVSRSDAACEEKS